MKKSILFFALCLCCLLAAAQKTQWEVGLLGGVSFNSGRGTAIDKQFLTSAVGYGLGVQVKTTINNHLAIKAIPSFDADNGWRYKNVTFQNPNGSGLANGDVFYQLDFLNLPIVAEYSFGEKTKFYIDGGIFGGFKADANLVTKIGGTITSGTSESFNNFNFGLSLGAGVQIPLGEKIRIQLGVRDNLGLVNIYKKFANSSGNIKTNSLGVNLGAVYAF